MGVVINGNTIVSGNVIFGANLNTSPSYPDSSFNIGSGFNDLIFSLGLQSDNKILCVGRFTQFSGVSANRIVRLNSDGSRDNTFTYGTGFNNDVFSVVLQSNGKILCAGNFTTYSGISANGLIRLNSDGSKDNTFNIGTGFSSNLYNLSIRQTKIQSDGKIVVGGIFTQFSGTSANGIIRLNSDGSRDNTFTYGTGFSPETSYSLEIQSDGKIIVGGGFTTYSGISANGIIRLNSDGGKDNSFVYGTGFSSLSPVTALNIQSDGKIIVGGTFVTYSGISANRIIRLNSDGSKDNSFVYGTGFNSIGGNSPYNIITDADGRIIVFGGYSSYNGGVDNNIIRLNSNGNKDNTFTNSVGFNNTTYCGLIQQDGKIVIGGFFTIYNNTSYKYLVRVNGN